MAFFRENVAVAQELLSSRLCCKTEQQIMSYLKNRKGRADRYADNPIIKYLNGGRKQPK